MKCLILAAGYATRLYPLTENFPKPLLEVAGKPILDWLIDDMEKTGLVDEYIIISNHKFAHIFEEWAAKSDRIRVLDDGTVSNETRLGAVRDIQFAIDQLQLDDDLLVMAGDNLLDFSLGDFVRYAADRKATCVMRYYEAEDMKLRVLTMEEKPAQPKSHWCCPAFYCYTREDSHRITEAIENGCGVDAPGSFIAWLCGKATVYAWEMPGRRYDIGNLESYEDVKKTFSEKYGA